MKVNSGNIFCSSGSKFITYVSGSTKQIQNTKLRQVKLIVKNIKKALLGPVCSGPHRKSFGRMNKYAF